MKENLILYSLVGLNLAAGLNTLILNDSLWGLGSLAVAAFVLLAGLRPQWLIALYQSETLRRRHCPYCGWGWKHRKFCPFNGRIPKIEERS